MYLQEIHFLIMDSCFLNFDHILYGYRYFFFNPVESPIK